MQAKAAIRFCEILFGHDYASLMSRAAENAVTGERKATKRQGELGSESPPAWPSGRLPSGCFLPQLSIAGLAAGGVKRRIGACLRRAVPPREPLDDAVVCVRADDGRGDLRRALAVEPRLFCAGRRQRGGGLQGSARRDRSRCRRGPDRRVRGRGRACRNRPPPAGRRGRRARPAGAVEPWSAPRFRDRGAGGLADRGGDVLPRARIAAARRFSAGLAHPRRGRQPAARQHGGAGRGASGKKSDRRPRLDRAGAGAGAARPLR